MAYKTKKQQETEEAKLADIMLRMRVNGVALELGGIKYLAEKIGMNYLTLLRRIHNPHEFTQEEIRLIAREERKILGKEAAPWVTVK